ncbi:hypothetical protein Hdeb2414_s0025g00670481 [Helianthus debilis subsp. tardiflorus]
MENGNITCDDVISKLKDDGDFDKLRIKIIRKIKENEELRNSIVSIVKESVAINRPGVENTKVRQLSDAIHHEVGGKLNEQISVALWELIRSPDGMKTEITETVRLVYDKLMRPKRAENEGSAARDLKRTRVEQQSVIHVDDRSVEGQQKVVVGRKQKVLENDNAQDDKHVQGDGSDEDLDAPPGFG